MRYLKHSKLKALVAILVLDGLFFGLTDPDSVNSILLIIGFILLGLTFFICVDALLGLIQLTGIKLRDKHKFAIYITLIVIAMLVLQSLGQLSIKDALVIIPIALIAYLYSSRLKT